MTLSFDDMLDRYQRRYPKYETLLLRYGRMNRLFDLFIEQHPSTGADRGGSTTISPETLATKTEFTDLLEAASAVSEPGESMRTLLDWALAGGNPLQKFQEFWASPDSFSQQTARLLAQPPEDVALFFILLLKPLYLRVRDAIPLAEPPRPFCHVCGSLPHFARLEKEERRRFLACPVCETQWPFPRFVCPFCGVASTEHAYFRIDQFAHHRVDLCTGCHSYIKTHLDNDLAGTIQPFLEDLVTPELDLAAAGEGYRKVAGYFAHGRE